MLPGRRHGAVVSYVRRAFCLDCRVASALPLRTVHGSLYPLPSQALQAVGGELAGGRCVARFVLAAVVHGGEGSHHLALAKPPTFLAGSDLAAGSGEERWLDLGSSEEEPVVMHPPELRSLVGWQMGCREACEELGKVV